MADPKELRSIAEKRNEKADELRSLADSPSSSERFGKQFVKGASSAATGLGEFLQEGVRTIGPGGAVNTVMQIMGQGEFEPGRQLAEKTGIPTFDPSGTQDIVDEWAGEADTMAGRAGELSGMAASLAIPGGRAAGAVQRTTQSGVPAKLRNLIASMGETYARSPGRAIATEAGLGATAGAGGYAAERMFPESDAARFVGEVAGGVGPGVALTGTRLAGRGAGKVAGNLPLARVALKKGREGLNRFKEQTQLGAGTGRAKRRIDRATQDREGALSRMDDDVLEDAPLSPAAKTEEPGLLSLERSVMNESDKLKSELGDNLTEINRVIRRGFQEDGTPEATADTFESAQTHLQDLLNSRISIAARKADEKINELGPKTDQETANRIASREVRKALDAAREQERELYKAIPMDAPAPTQTTQETFENLRSQLSKAQSGDMPSVAKRLLDPDSDQFLGPTTNIRELRGLQGKLREVSRRARSEGAHNKARMADDLADSIVDDIAATDAGDEAAESVQTAVQFSRDLNERFSRGSTGRLLGRTKEGGEKVAESLSLESTLSGGGPQSRQAYDEIVSALDNPQTGTDANIFRSATEDYIKNRFFKSPAIENGQINPAAARRFMGQNEELLNRIPALKQQIGEAIESGDLVALRRGQSERLRFTPSQSKATMFIQKGPRQAFDAALSSRKTSQEIQNLINMTKRDATGEAYKGLKSSFKDYLMNRAMVSPTDNAGERFISGTRLKELSDDPKINTAMNKMFTDDEKTRFNQIVNTARKLDKARTASPSTEGILGDEVGQTAEFIARVLGAVGGRRLGQRLGSGGTVQIPGEGAKRFSQMLESGVIDPARRLLSDAVQDEKLFKDVLKAEISPSGELPDKARRRLNAWAAGVMAEQGESLREYSNEQPPQ